MIDSHHTLWRQHAWLNRLQALLLLSVMASFLALLGWLVWGDDGIVMLLIVGVMFVFFNPAFSPRLIMNLYGASHISPNQAPGLYSILQELAQRAGLSVVPRMYYVPSPLVNSFTTGRTSESVIAVTDGWLRELDAREQIGVLAHEISHIRSYDIWVMSLADVFSRLTSLLSMLGQILLFLNLPLLILGHATVNWFAIFILIFAPTLTTLAQLGLSRTREYDADLNAIRLTGDPVGLARALVKIEKIQGSWLERLLLPGRKILPNGVFVSVKGTAATRVRVQTNHGELSFPLARSKRAWCHGQTSSQPWSSPFAKGAP